MLPDRRIARCLCLVWPLVGCGGDPSGDTSGASSDTGDAPPTTSTTASLPTTGDATSMVSATATSDDPNTSVAATGTSVGDTTADDTTSDPTGGTTEGGLTRRPADPVVMIGGQIPGLAGALPGDIVGFAWRGGWQQVPIQVDERVLVDFCQLYAEALLGDDAPCKTSKVVQALFYADPNTYTGPDTDPVFDSDDELVFMARDAGGRIDPVEDPSGVVAGSGVEVEVVDGDETGWVYLFRRTDDGGLDPAAGVDLVSYSVVFDPAIDYKTEYPFIGKGSCGDAVCDPPILEDSRVKSDHYERHFSARWVTDVLKLTTDGSSGQDILDIAQDRFAPGVCGRHVLTFSTSEGAFITNIDGPVRAIRSYMGANSGPLTQRTHLFYDRVEVVHTFLRVHPIPAIMDLIDYATDAQGMTYYNEHNEGGVAIDGEPDPGFDDQTFTWELVSGPHGSVVHLIDPKFSQDLGTQAYWEDKAVMPTDQCSESNLLDHPDDSAWGTSGLWVTTAIPDTDPRNNADDYLFIARTSYYEAADLALVDAMDLVDRARTPPQVHARNQVDHIACGDATCDKGEELGCPQDCTPIDRSCGDTICDLWENSVNCVDDCGDGVMPPEPGCGNGVCDPDEHELSCAEDCWAATFEPIVDCMAMSCGVQKGACSDELPCVDRVVCVAECVAGGGAINTCTTMCNMQVPATMEQAGFATALLTCTQQNCL